MSFPSTAPPATTLAEQVRRAFLVPINSVPYSMALDQDCSAFVSLVCMGIARQSTVTLKTGGHVREIAWADVQPGDIIGRLGVGTAGAAGHVMQCVGRSSSGAYVVMEQAIGGAGPDRSVYSQTNLVSRAMKPYRSVYIRQTSGGAIMFCKKGDHGDVVSAMQLLILAAGGSLAPFGADGDYGDVTAAALVHLGVTGGVADGSVYGPSEYAGLMVKVAERNTGAVAHKHKWSTPAASGETGTPVNA